MDVFQVLLKAFAQLLRAEVSKGTATSLVSLVRFPKKKAPSPNRSTGPAGNV